MKVTFANISFISAGPSAQNLVHQGRRVLLVGRGQGCPQQLQTDREPPVDGPGFPASRMPDGLLGRTSEW